MPFQKLKQVTIAINGGNTTNAFAPPAEPCRTRTSQPRPRTVANRTPKSPVQLGTKLKFVDRSYRLCFSSCGAVKGSTSSKSIPCATSPTSRTLAAMQSHFFSTQAVPRTHPFWVQSSCGRRRTPAPNPSFERTRSGRPRTAFISFWAMRVLPARAAQVKR